MEYKIVRFEISNREHKNEQAFEEGASEFQEIVQYYVNIGWKLWGPPSHLHTDYITGSGSLRITQIWTQTIVKDYVDTTTGTFTSSWKGSWNNSSTYETGDLVEWQGSTWVATTNMAVGEEPDDDPDWELVAQRGDFGPEGSQGIPGPQGIQGDPGPAGISGLGFASNEGEITTTSNVLFDVLLTSPSLSAGNHILYWYAEHATASKSEIQILADGLPIGNSIKTLPDYDSTSGLIFLPILLVGSHEFKIQFRRFSGTGVSRIRRMRLEWYKVP